MRRNARKYLFSGLGVLLIIALCVFGRSFLKSVFINEYYQSDDAVVAIFDRSSKSETFHPGAIPHYKAILRSTALFSSSGSVEAALADHDVLITVETWPNRLSYHKNVLSEIVHGKFDFGIKQLAKLAAEGKHQVYIRWAPDMEVPVQEYPWQFQSSDAYNRAFVYFAQKIKQYAPKVKIVWGPSGYPGDTEYWPGSQAVDLASITLGSNSEYSLNVYPKDQTIPEMLKHKLHRLRFINKPVLVIRSSHVNHSDFKASWLSDQQAYMDKYKDLIYATSNYVDTGKVKPLRKHLDIGAFDPNKKLIEQNFITVEHLFTDWGELKRGDFERKFREVIDRNHDPIVTMEPWHDIDGKAENNALEAILSGKHDAEIRKLFHIISSVQRKVYLRWMHEMEIPIHRYPWQSQDPENYINTFRYFMKFEGGPGSNVKKIWGPAGDRGSIDFWPGDDVVDFISIAIYGLPDKNITDPEQQESFRTIFERKYHRMRFADKPLFITEFGVKGPEKFQDKWLSDAAKTINAYPQIFGVCYFNLYDNPKAWGHIKAPDWSITPASMQRFYSLLKQ